MNDFLVGLGLASWKPVLTTLLLPPVPLLLLAWIGLRLRAARAGRGGLLLALAGAGIWLGACSGAAEWLQQAWLSPPPALSGDKLARLQPTAGARASPAVVVVLGGGTEALAPEYGAASLSAPSLERLRYGVWLGRQLQAPLMFSGGVGHASGQSLSEAEIAAQIAAREFGRPLRWTEGRSRDTRENALNAVAMLREAAPAQLVLVTHGWHMPRALRAFQQASAAGGAPWEVVAAPMGLAKRTERPVLRWLPSSEGFTLMRAVLREKIGWWMGS